VLRNRHFGTAEAGGIWQEKRKGLVLELISTWRIIYIYIFGRTRFLIISYDGQPAAVAEFFRLIRLLIRKHSNFDGVIGIFIMSIMPHFVSVRGSRPKHLKHY